jgi:hypothetical protein
VVLREETAVAGSRILHNEELYNFYSSRTPDIITSVKLRRVRCVKHIEGT